MSSKKYMKYIIRRLDIPEGIRDGMFRSLETAYFEGDVFLLSVKQSVDNYQLLSASIQNIDEFLSGRNAWQGSGVQLYCFDEFKTLTN